MSKKTNWKIQINNGPVLDLKTETTLYEKAALIAIATLPYKVNNDGLNTVKIWCEKLVHEYGPYYYQVAEPRSMISEEAGW